MEGLTSTARAAVALALLTALSLLPAAPLAAQTGGDTVAQLVDRRGAVENQLGPPNPWSAAAVGQLYAPSDEVRTGADGWAAVLSADESMLQLNRGSRLIFKEIAPVAGWLARSGVAPVAGSRSRSTYELEKGELWLRNKTSRLDLRVDTPTVSAAIRGSEVNIRIDDEQSVLITVLEGVVDASNELGSVTGQAGERILTRPGAAPRLVLVVDIEDAVQWTLSVPRLTGPGDLLPRDEEPDAGWRLLARGEAAAALEEFSRAGAEDPAALLGRSVALADLGRLEESRRLLEQGRQRFPAAAALPAQAAYLDLRNGEPRAARAAASQATEADPGYALGWSLSAIAELVLGDKDAATTASAEAVRLEPDSVTAWIVRGYVLQAAFDLDGARSAVERALELDDGSVPAWVNLAKLDFGADRIRQARAAAERALAIDAADAEARSLNGFLELASNDTDAALASFAAASSADPALGEPHLGASLALMRQGEPDAALEEISKAVLLEPRRSLFLSYWAKLLHQLRRFDEALSLLELARELDSRDPTPELYRAIILRDLNRPTEAIRALNRAIQLNDRRAVYRSRFLLDRDLAVKNVNLSLLYNQLGMSDWGQNKALASIKEDYANSSAHIFLAGSLLGREGRATAGGNENLLGILLQPANLNSFNTFNEYTSFVEQPDLSGQIIASGGSDDTRQGSLLAFGAVPRSGLAMSVFGASQQTDGWRGTNFFDSDNLIGQLKWDPTLDDSLTLQVTSQDSRRGDGLSGPFEIDQPPDPFAGASDDSSRVRLGYRRRLSPDSLLLAVASRTEREQGSSFQELDLILGLPVQFLTTTALELPFSDAQLEYQRASGRHQLILGTYHYWGEQRFGSTTDAFLLDGEDRILIDSFASEPFDLDNVSHSFYVQDIWTAGEKLTVEAALHYDEMSQVQIVGTVIDRDELSPRLGLVYKPTPDQTVRLAAFRYLIPFVSSRIDPSDIAGVPVLRTNLSGAVAEEVDLAWEREWESGFFSTNLFVLDREYEVDRIGGPDPLRVVEKSSATGFEQAYNQLVAEGCGLTQRLTWLEVEDEGFPLLDREDVRASATLQCVRPSGLTAALGGLYRSIDFDAPGRPSEEIWLADLAVGYELPGKRGALALTVRNLFDAEFNWTVDPFVFIGRPPARQLLASLTLNL